MSSPNPSIAQPETTGKYLVLLRENEVNAGIEILSDAAGVSGVARAADFEANALSGQQLENAETLIFDNLGVAVVTLDPDQLQSLNLEKADSSSVIEEIEPERVVYALSDVGVRRLGQPMSSSTTNVSVEYLRGYRDGVTKLVDQLLSTDEGDGINFHRVENTRLWKDLLLDFF